MATKAVTTLPFQSPTPAPDGAPARHYDNTGSGLSTVSGKNYNEAHGRSADAPTLGGPVAPAKPSGRIPAAYKKQKPAR